MWERADVLEALARRDVAQLLRLVQQSTSSTRPSSALQRAGFAIIGTEVSYANGRKKEIAETILRLDEPR
jgi:hypothetical protein